MLHTHSKLAAWAALSLAAAAAQADPVAVRVLQAQGEAQIDGAPARPGSTLAAQALRTGADGHLQVRTVDGALVDLPPSSRLAFGAAHRQLTRSFAKSTWSRRSPLGSKKINAASPE